MQIWIFKLITFTRTLFPDKSLKNEVLSGEARSHESDKKLRVSDEVSDKHTNHDSININKHNENSKRHSRDSKATKDAFMPLKRNLNRIKSKHNDTREKSKNDNVQDEEGEIERDLPENESALKQIESMMGRNYSDFMRSLASKYNKE